MTASGEAEKAYRDDGSGSVIRISAFQTRRNVLEGTHARFSGVDPDMGLRSGLGRLLSVV